MTTSTIRRAGLALTATAALGAAAMTGVAATSHASTPPVTRALTAAAGEKLRFSVTRPAGARRQGDAEADQPRRPRPQHRGARPQRSRSPASARSSAPGKVSKVTATLPAGTYTFYCSVFGHESSGMRGTLTVAAR